MRANHSTEVDAVGRNDSDFLKSVVASDETFQRNPETKRQSGSGNIYHKSNKKAGKVPSKIKTMLITFLDSNIQELYRGNSFQQDKQLLANIISKFWSFRWPEFVVFDPSIVIQRPGVCNTILHRATSHSLFVKFWLEIKPV
ncbi:hypothetical protein Trydic_g12412 [Trypoxylus dichotomus]